MFPRKGTESGSIRNLTSSWSCPPLALPQTGATHQVSRVTNNWFLCKPLCSMLGGMRRGENEDFGICKVRTIAIRTSSGYWANTTSAKTLRSCQFCGEHQVLVCQTRARGNRRKSERVTGSLQTAKAETVFCPLPAEARSGVADSPAAARAGPSALHSPQGMGGSRLWP